jgi:hypothetical protein
MPPRYGACIWVCTTNTLPVMLKPVAYLCICGDFLLFTTAHELARFAAAHNQFV